jgi:hypothetical protein
VLILQPTSCIVLHAANLSFTSASINTGGGARCLCGLDDTCATSNCSSIIGSVAPPAPAPAANASSSSSSSSAAAASSTVVLDLGLMLLDAGTVAQLHFNYLLPLAGPQQQQGLWRSQPFALQQQQEQQPGGSAGAPAALEVLLSTQLEKAGARYLLPCFDEPRFRAQFALRVELPAGKVALSNMRQAASRPSGSASLMLTFETSPPMPTYLFAVAAGTLQSISAPLEGFEGGPPAPPGLLGCRLAPAVPAPCRQLSLLLRPVRAAAGGRSSRP